MSMFKLLEYMNKGVDLTSEEIVNIQLYGVPYNIKKYKKVKEMFRPPELKPKTKIVDIDKINVPKIKLNHGKEKV